MAAEVAMWVGLGAVFIFLIVLSSCIVICCCYFVKKEEDRNSELRERAMEERRAFIMQNSPEALTYNYMPPQMMYMHGPMYPTQCQQAAFVAQQPPSVKSSEGSSGAGPPSSTPPVLKKEPMQGPKSVLKPKESTSMRDSATPSSPRLIPIFVPVPIPVSAQSAPTSSTKDARKTPAPL